MNGTTEGKLPHATTPAASFATSQEIWSKLSLTDGTVSIGESTVGIGSAKQDVRAAFGDNIASVIKGRKGTAFYLTPTIIGNAGTVVVTLGKKFFDFILIYGEGRDFAEAGEDISDVDAMKKKARAVFDDITERIKGWMPKANFKDLGNLRYFFGDNFKITLELTHNENDVSLHIARKGFKADI